MSIDLSPLSRAVDRLAEGLARYRQDESDEQIRDGLIQRFEFTYEVSHRLLKRYLESVSPSPGEYDLMPFADLIRSANERDLLRGDWPAWRRYRELRSKSSHVYSAEIAAEVVAGIPDFLAEAQHLRDVLQERLG